MLTNIMKTSVKEMSSKVLNIVTCDDLAVSFVQTVPWRMLINGGDLKDLITIPKPVLWA